MVRAEVVAWLGEARRLSAAAAPFPMTSTQTRVGARRRLVAEFVPGLLAGVEGGLWLATELRRCAAEYGQRADQARVTGEMRLRCLREGQQVAYAAAADRLEQVLAGALGLAGGEADEVVAPWGESS